MTVTRNQQNVKIPQVDLTAAVWKVLSPLVVVNVKVYINEKNHVFSYVFLFPRLSSVLTLYWNLIFKYKLDRHSCFFLVTSDNVGLLVHFAESHKILLYITDVDECEEGQHNCDKNADCGNRIGGYSCTCKQGYEGDGRTCKGTLDAAKLSSLVEIRECLYTIPSTDLLLLTQSLRTIKSVYVCEILHTFEI